jgi:hypothetical protein
MKDYYLKKAEENLPFLFSEEIRPDTGAVALKQGDSFVLDLGNHYVGHLSFKLWFLDDYIDAPVTLAVRFAETARELSDDYGAYHGLLSASWLPEDVVKIDFPGIFRMPRRHAARFVRFTAVATPKPFSLSEFCFTATTSGDRTCVPPLALEDPLLRRIDEVAVNTLKNCMQRVFEDGPRRDRRLWIGDYRLEALANYKTFQNAALVRRCLYLFAAAERNGAGFLPGFVYENPIFYSGNWYLRDYSMMYVVSLADYLAHTKDEETFRDLLPVAEALLLAMEESKDENGIVRAPEGDIFIDWCPDLRKETAFHGVYLYTLDRWHSALLSLGLPAQEIRRRLLAGREAALGHLFDPEANRPRLPYDGGEGSAHATVWMILGGVIEGKEAQSALSRILADPTAKQPFTPYMHHYVAEAIGMAEGKDAALAYIKRIWGGILTRGGDTFPEVYVKEDPEFSSNGDRMMDSMCHAWSCTPCYFIRA